ncbi:MAG: hypothetical protein DRI90_27895, partial [Deltaproteobacteria bacterium]
MSWIAVAVAAQACSASSDTDPGGGCTAGTTRCYGNLRQVCEGGTYVDSPCPSGEFCDTAVHDCVACACEPGQAGECINSDNLEICREDCTGYDAQPCDFGESCENGSCADLLCPPGTRECLSEVQYQQCTEDGSAWGPPVDCEPGSVCLAGACVDPCDAAEETDSNVGCHFWAVDMPNLPPRDSYVFAVVISNPSTSATANIEIFDKNGGTEQLILSGTVAPRDVTVFNLSGSSSGQQGHYPGDAGFLGTGISLGRAFRLQADLPVVAVQFNPIGGASGYTTDASLLLPAHVIGTHYIHLAWDQGYGEGSNLMVVGTADNTTVTITPTVNTVAGQNGLPAMTAGQPTQVIIGQYDYIQLSTGPSNVDLSGSTIVTSAPVAVFGGHTCANIPTTSTTACDHVEEQIFPLTTWGREYVAARNPIRGGEPMLWRIVGSEDNTTLTFDPPVAIGASTTINKGQVIQFEDDQDFYVSANGGPVLVAGYMLGCSSVTGASGCPGDPYMVLMVPVEQFQPDYVLLVDSSYDEDFVKLVRPVGADVEVACFGVVPDDRWTAVGTSGYETAQVQMNPGEGTCTTGTNEA